MLPGKDEWWTDERVESTVNAHFLWSHLALHGEKLQSRVFSTSFSEDTYLQFILKRTRRLFLTLVTVGIAPSIFDLVDCSYDDEDLPIAEENISTLRLPKDRLPNIEQTFYRIQFKYLLRVPRDGEHIRYAKSEVVPVQSLQQKSLASTDRSDQVKLPSDKTLLRRRITLEESRNEIDILAEIAASNPLKHEHILSVFASYQYDGAVHILITPSAKQTLKSFLNDLPKPFLAMSKTERRQHFLTASSCLANALTWLHSLGIHHGAIRPSRVLLDDKFQPSLGQFEGEGVLGSPTAKDDLEAYQYGAPEFWRRELTVQGAGTPRSSGGSRIGRSGSIRQGSAMYPSSNSSTSQDASITAGSAKTYTFVPTAKGNSSRLRLESVGHQRRISVPPAARDIESRVSSRQELASDTSKPLHNFYRRFDALSVNSSNSSDYGKRNGSQPSLFFSVPVEDRSTVVIQAWKSAARDLPVADVFALAAVIMDILTVMCSRTTSSFAKHRSSKNRQAGRGGGLADASFHANLSTLPSWAEALHKDAEKKMKKEEGTIFRAVGPTLQVTLQCLDKDPSKRLDSESLAKHLQQHMATFAGISQTHCIPKLAQKKTSAGKQSSNSQSTLKELMASDKRQSVLKTPSSAVSHDTILLDHLDRGSVIPESFKSHRPSALQDSDAQSTLVDDFTLDGYENYDPHPGIRWDAAQLRGLSPKPLQVRPRVRIEPSITEGNYAPSTTYAASTASSPPSLSRTTATHRSRFENSEPGTPIAYVPSHFFQHAQNSNDRDQYYSHHDYLPPDRDLPPIPSNTPMSRQRAGSDSRRQKISPKQAMHMAVDVDHATNLLAETINVRNPRYAVYEEYQMQMDRPPRKSSRAPHVPQQRYYIEEDYEDEVDERYGYDQRSLNVRR